MNDYIRLIGEKPPMISHEYKPLYTHTFQYLIFHFPEIKKTCTAAWVKRTDTKNTTGSLVFVYNRNFYSVCHRH